VKHLEEKLGNMTLNTNPEENKTQIDSRSNPKDDMTMNNEEEHSREQLR